MWDRFTRSLERLSGRHPRRPLVWCALAAALGTLAGMRLPDALAYAPALAAALLSAFLIPASAMDDTYSFDEFGMSIKLPKSYYVITRETPRDDKVFSDVGLEYDETLTAFRNADIYLRAYDPDKVLQHRITASANLLRRLGWTVTPPEVPTHE